MPGMGIRVVRRKRQGVAERGDALLVGSVVVERGAEIGPGLGIVGLDRDGAAIADGRLVELPQRMQGVAQIAVRLGEFRIGGDRLAVDARGLLVVLELVERDAEIAQRHRHVGLDLDRPPRQFGRELGAAGETQHLAEIGVKERDLGRQPDRLLDVLDRIAQVAVLVGDQPEEMLGYRQVGLRFENAPADRLGLDQPAFGAAALDVHERIVNRHEAGVCRRGGKLVHRGFDTMGLRGRPRGNGAGRDRRARKRLAAPPLRPLQLSNKRLLHEARHSETGQEEDNVPRLLYQPHGQLKWTRSFTALAAFARFVPALFVRTTASRGAEGRYDRPPTLASEPLGRCVS